MSRLDSFIRRLQAQRKCLDEAVELVAGLAGPALELGLGNGRTYDHLRARMPGRDIYVFERTVAAHPDCIPPDDRLFLGDVRATLTDARKQLEGQAVLAHCDIGTGDKQATVALAREISPLLAPLLAPGAVVVSDQAMVLPSAASLDLPEGVAEGRYYMYRMPPAQARSA
jgi:hypothetical protein